MTPVGLTPKQARCLEFIKGYIWAHGYSPGYREIRDGLGVASTNSAHKIVRSLIERGHVTSLPGRNRSIALVEAA